MDSDHDSSINSPSTTLMLTSAVVDRLLPLHLASVAAKQRLDDAIGLLKDALQVPQGADVHLDLDAKTLSFEVHE